MISAPAQDTAVSVLICTCCRNAQLALLLADLAAQIRPPAEVVVVDNDAGGGAEPVVAAFQAGSEAPFPVRYAVQPVRSIALTRNLSVRLAQGAWLAFADDDERAGPDWLERLLDCALRHRADGVIGPVRCLVPDDAPDWIRRGRFYDLPRAETGTEIPPNRMFIGNALLRADRVKALEGPFDAGFGLSGGEDTDFFARLYRSGARLVWCDDAVLSEPVAPARLSQRWILMRAMSGGQSYGRVWNAGGYGPVTPLRRLGFGLRALAQLGLGLSLAALSLPAGRHRAVHQLGRAMSAYGKLGALFGQRYQQYAPRSARPGT